MERIGLELNSSVTLFHGTEPVPTVLLAGIHYCRVELLKLPGVVLDFDGK